MAEGFISHGVGTVIEVYGAGDGDRAGTCSVIWDSNRCHTRPLHSKLGNCHSAHVGKNGEYHLVLAEEGVCSNLEVKAHRVVERGLARTHLEVVPTCALAAKELEGSAEGEEQEPQQS
uniref:Uncharacterized protein n=1 Tax=Hemiselmis andersenii TaxID=464988 RepID=A0A6U4NRX3_HEMAN